MPKSVTKRLTFVLILAIAFSFVAASFANAAGCNHQFQHYSVNPTCTTIGYSYDSCNICGLVQNYIFLNATGHNWKLVYSDSYRNVYYCNKCGSTLEQPK